MKKILLGLGTTAMVSSLLVTGLFAHTNHNLKADPAGTSSTMAALNNNFGSEFKMLSGSQASVDKNGNVWAINTDKKVCYNSKVIGATIPDWGTIQTSSLKIILTSDYAFCVDSQEKSLVAISLKDQKIQIVSTVDPIFGIPGDTQLLEVGKDAKTNEKLYMAIIHSETKSKYALIDLNDKEASKPTLTAKSINGPVFPDGDADGYVFANSWVKFTNNSDDSSKTDSKISNSWIVAYKNSKIATDPIKFATLNIKLATDADQIKFAFKTEKLKDTSEKSIDISQFTNVTTDFYKKNDKLNIAGFDATNKIVNLEISIQSDPTAQLSYTSSEVAVDAAKNINGLSYSAYDNLGDLFFVGKMGEATDMGLFEIEANQNSIMQVTNGVASGSIFSDLELDQNEKAPILHATFGKDKDSQQLYDLSIPQATNNTALVVLGSIFGVVAGLGIIGGLVYYFYNKQNSSKSSAASPSVKKASK